MGPTWGPPGSCRPQMGPMLGQWTLLPSSSYFCSCVEQRSPAGQSWLCGSLCLYAGLPILPLFLCAQPPSVHPTLCMYQQVPLQQPPEPTGQHWYRSWWSTGRPMPCLQHKQSQLTYDMLNLYMNIWSIYKERKHLFLDKYRETVIKNITRSILGHLWSLWMHECYLCEWLTPFLLLFFLLPLLLALAPVGFPLFLCLLPALCLSFSASSSQLINM